MVKRVKVVYYGSIADIPKDGIAIEGESVLMPFSPSEPPFFKIETNKKVTFLDWIAIFDIIEEPSVEPVSQ